MRSRKFNCLIIRKETGYPLQVRDIPVFDNKHEEDVFIFLRTKNKQFDIKEVVVYER